MPVAHVLDVGILGPVEFIGRYADPLIDEHALRDAQRMRVSEKFPDFLLDRFDLVFTGALSPGHPGSAVLVQDVERHGCETVFRVECVIADISRGDVYDGYACRFGYLLLQSFEMSVDSLRLPSRVGEYGVVDLGENSFGGHGEHRGGLNSGAE